MCRRCRAGSRVGCRDLRRIGSPQARLADPSWGGRSSRSLAGRTRPILRRPGPRSDATDLRRIQYSAPSWPVPAGSRAGRVFGGRDRGACGASSTAGQHGVASTNGAVHPTDAKTFSIRPLVQSLSSSCPSFPANPADAVLPTQINGSPTGCAEVGPAAVTAADVSGAQLEAAGTASVTLTPAGLAALDQLTSANYGKQVATVVLGTVVAEPTV